MDFKVLNLALGFLIELVMLWSIGLWGFQMGTTPILKWLLGIGLPLLVAVFWGTFMAPKALYPLSDGLHLFMQIVLFGLAALALVFAGKAGLGTGFAVVVAINLALAALWKQ
ncbi:YrdB family protein [Deinococcus roseus]|uniref:DUF2568 domain-containing protein n=1 Tax=Deinococcus roseus TaxID=392414 RepID=A0ABQ2D959_9DEIO|nr:YrdB family protein [Deinococcus roseus]GGJ46359.1 hypothetical protein GCM10008938_35660 [Deinococcus roseus]